jgi:hypothetical protein
MPLRRSHAIALIPFLLAACSSIPYHANSAAVRVTHNEPTGCRFLGDATGNQGNFFTGQYTSNSNLETGARNDLKNKAHAMGGNVVYLLTDRAGVSGGQGGQTQTNVTLSGNIYHCPEPLT